MLSAEKKQLRQQICSQRKDLSPNKQQIASQQIRQTIVLLDIFQASQSVALYHATDGEPDLFPLAQTEAKSFYLPTITQNKELFFFPYHYNDALHKNRYGILEPILKETPVSPQTIDLILLPLVAFDEKGNRLGRGAGYYDRTFAFKQENPKPKKPYLLGIGYEFQKIPVIQTNSWDIGLNGVVTESMVYYF